MFLPGFFLPRRFGGVFVYGGFMPDGVEGPLSVRFLGGGEVRKAALQELFHVVTALPRRNGASAALRSACLTPPVHRVKIGSVAVRFAPPCRRNANPWRPAR